MMKIQCNIYLKHGSGAKFRRQDSGIAPVPGVTVIVAMVVAHIAAAIAVVETVAAAQEPTKKMVPGTRTIAKVTNCSGARHSIIPRFLLLFRLRILVSPIVLLRLGCFHGVWMQSHIVGDRKSTRLNSSHVKISYAVSCLKKKRSY